MANILRWDKQKMVIRCLVEGNSVRSTERMTGVHRDTVIRLMVRAGNGSKKIMDGKLVGLNLENIQLDEIWGYVAKKQRHVNPNDDQEVVGDMWTFVAIDAETKLVPCFLVGKRTLENAQHFINDLASRLDSRVQLSADKLPAYVESIWNAFGPDADFAQIVKSYEAEPIGPGRYSPPKVVSTEKFKVFGSPEMESVSTSFVERQNLTMRMGIRRLTRLTNAFSKKAENLDAAIALHFGYYNFVRQHRTIKTTPAVKAGIEKWSWKLDDFLDRALSYSNSN